MSRPGDGVTEELAALLGVESQYYDIWGNLHTASPETKRAILSAMGIKDAAASLKERKMRPWNRVIEPVMVVPHDGQPASIPVHFPLEDGQEHDVVLSILFRDEGGATEGKQLRGIVPSLTAVIEGVRYVKVEIPNETRRELGYHTISVKVRTPALELSGTMRLVVAPETCHVPEVRTWGVSVNLYSLRSERNWGFGDLGDLGEAVRWLKSLGGGFVGINPLHAIPNRPPRCISPYFPVSRLYRNFLYLDMEDVLKSSPRALELARAPEFAAEIRSLREAREIDYEKIGDLKMRVLEAAFDDFLIMHMSWETPEAQEFRKYVTEQGQHLESFATFMALEQHLNECGRGGQGWREWPLEYRDPQGKAVAEFRGLHKDRVLFYEFIQWLLDRQMKKVDSEACGMPLGIYNDLAVGSSGQGSDAWGCPEVFAFGVSAGAPPDDFSLNGQDWGFPPLIPETLRESGYELFIQTIRQNLRNVKALRIDHALGLFRLFWIPEGMSPKEGTYVRYPHEDLMRIIALESVRNGAAIIAEDLGTIGDEVREALHRTGMLSYRLFYFERDWKSGAFLPPGSYPELAIAAVTTHDLPTLKGYWSGRDIAVKEKLSIYRDDASYDHDVMVRERDRQSMLDALRECLPGDFPGEAGLVAGMPRGLSLAVHRFLARTPSRMVAVNLDDIMGAEDQQNMPGTLDGHPNWRRKSSLGLEELFGKEEARTLARMFREERRA